MRFLFRTGLLRISTTASRPALIALGAFALAVGACGSSGASSDASASAISTSGELRATLHPASDPPALGNQTVAMDLVYVDGGAPATGMRLSIVPWMPAMQHGTSIVPSVSEISPGTYAVSDVDMFMPGVWELRTSVVSAASGDAGTLPADKVAPSLDVP